MVAPNRKAGDLRNANTKGFHVGGRCFCLVIYLSGFHKSEGPILSKSGFCPLLDF